jgi:hypothetical protein
MSQILGCAGWDFAMDQEGKSLVLGEGLYLREDENSRAASDFSPPAQRNSVQI